FKTQFKVDWVPSRFRLREDLYGYIVGITNNDQLDAESWAYLKKMFPKIPTPTAAGSVAIDWNGSGTVDQPVDLEGHQCLVFFLGGIPSYGPNTSTGFSTNPANPATPGGERIGPFYNDFKSDRLMVLPTLPVSYATFPSTGASNPYPSVVNGATAPGFFSYLDPFAKDTDFPGKTPVFAYFSTYKKNNGYNRYYGYYVGNPDPTVSAFPTDNRYLIVEDATMIGLPATGLWPYAQKIGQPVTATPEYLNPNTFQILCAGPDKVFGQGTKLIVVNNVWTTTSSTWTPQNTGGVTPLGRDDFSNFHDRPMGSG